MVTRAQEFCRTAVLTATLAGALMIGGLLPPAAPTGWAAGPTTFVWGQSGNPDTLDMPWRPRTFR
jgi:hypothetical protein